MPRTLASRAANLVSRRVSLSPPPAERRVYALSRSTCGTFISFPLLLCNVHSLADGVGSMPIDACLFIGTRVTIVVPYYAVAII